MAELWVPGRPHPKERPRRGRNGSFYTPQKTRDEQRRIAALWEEAGLPKFLGPTGVHLSFQPEGTLIVVEEMEDVDKVILRGDIDNYEKLVLDALNKRAWHDDSKVVRVVADKM